jgi:hypothetical protein
MYTRCTLHHVSTVYTYRMGWLKEQAKERGHASLRATALKMEKSQLWPTKLGRNAETIANKLRQADQRIDVRWWIGTGKAFLPALAEVLGKEREELVEHLLNTASAAREAAAASWMFKLFPALRAIDLLSEPLFPGIPAEIAREGGPRALRTWWVAPPGAGKTLVGSWLAARYGWTYRSAARWSELEIPEQGRLFVELASVEDVTLDVLKAIPEDLRICIAAPRAPNLSTQATRRPETTQATVPSEQTLSSIASTTVVPLPSSPRQGPSLPSPWAWMAGFYNIEPPPPATWISALIGWVTARVGPGGGFDGERVQKLFRTEPFASLFATPGELLGFLGIVDDVGVDGIESVQRQPQRWIRVWLKAVMDRTDRRHAAGIADLLRKRGDEILVLAEMERLRRGMEPTLPVHSWAELLPHESAPPLDRDRLIALVEGDSSDALQQIRVMLKPDPMSIAQGLQAAGVLEEAGDDRLVLRPTWVANTLGNIAIDRLHDSGPTGIGALLLFSATSKFTVDKLVDEVCAGSLDRVTACAAMLDPRSPEQAAALDGAFRATGLAVLVGAKVPTDLLSKLWDRQMSCVARRFMNWPQQPVLAVASSDTWRGVGAIGAWFLAALAISHALCDAGVTLPCSALNPWAHLPEADDERARCLEALNNIAIVFGPLPDLAWKDPRRLAVFHLGGELLDRYGVLRRLTSMLDIQAPDIVVELSRGKPLEISDEEHAQLLELPFGLEALEDACHRREVDLDHVLAWCWTQWSTTPWRVPPLLWSSHAQSSTSLDDAKRLWSIVPASALSNELFHVLPDHPKIWAWLPVPFWTRWIERWSDDPGRWAKSAAPFSWLPTDLALHALRTGAVNAPCHDVRARLWERMPDALIALIDEFSSIAPSPPSVLGSSGAVSECVWSAPQQHRPALIERARRWLSSPANYPGIGAWVHQWLMDVIQQRSTGWLDAYSILIESTTKRDVHTERPSSEEPDSPSSPTVSPGR